MMAPTCLTSSLSVVHPLTKDIQQSLHSKVQKYNSLRDKRQMKWHPLVIRFALNLKYMSTSAYQAVHQEWRHQVYHLSELVLINTHWASVNRGVQIGHLKCLLKSEVKLPQLYQCALSMDEMKIKSGLVFSKRNGSLVGYITLRSVNRDME